MHMSSLHTHRIALEKGTQGKSYKAIYGLIEVDLILDQPQLIVGAVLEAVLLCIETALIYKATRAICKLTKKNSRLIEAAASSTLL